MPTVIVLEDLEKAADDVIRDLEEHVSGPRLRFEKVNYLDGQGVPKTPQFVAEETHEIIAKGQDRVALLVDLSVISVKKNESYGLHVISKVAELASPGTRTADFLLNDNIFVIIVSHFNIDQTEMQNIWHSRQREVAVISLVDNAAVESVVKNLQARSGKRAKEKILPILFKGKHDVCLWRLIEEWAKLNIRKSGGRDSRRRP